MKRRILYLIGAVSTALLMFSCQSEPTGFDASLLIGYWQSGTEYWRYDSNARGVTWDTSDDVDESEAQWFKWELSEDELLHIHLFDNGADGPPKYYTVTTLTATSLKYEDTTGKKFSFTKTTQP